MTERIRVLHVDDEPDFADMAAEFLERDDDSITVESAGNAAEGREFLAAGSFDCIVSDYDMPDQHGIEFLRSVREDFPALPFILFTGKGSEEVAAEAISSGVTDYLQKEPGTDHYTVLANRIRNTVEKHRFENELERARDLSRRAQEIANIGVWEADLEADEGWWSEEVSRIFGLPPEDTGGLGAGTEYFHPEDRPVIEDAFDRAIEDGTPYDLELRLTGADGVDRWVRARADPSLENGEVVRVRGTLQDITETKTHMRELERQRNRFAALFQTVPEPAVHVVFEGSDPVVRRVNEAFEEVFGYGSDEARGESLDHLIVPAGETDAAEINRSVRETGFLQAEVRRETVDGVQPFLFTAQTMDLEQGDTTRVEGVGTYVDLTEQ